MNVAAMDASSWRLLILVVLALAVGGYLWYLERRGPRERDTLTRFRTLTEEQLRTLPDEEVLFAVIANVMTRQDKRHPEPYYQLPLFSPGQNSVYTVWAACREEESRGFEALFTRRTRPLTEAAVAGFQGIGAPQCAAVLQAALAESAAERAAGNTAEEWARAVKEEAPLSLCVAYIRENPAEFVEEKATSDTLQET